MRWRPRSVAWTVLASTRCANCGASGLARCRPITAPTFCAAALATNFKREPTAACPPQTRRRLTRLHEAFKADPAYMPLPRLGLKPGTVLTRNWRGVLHQVGVTQEGFEYRNP
jgi:hypothetical protein